MELSPVTLNVQDLLTRRSGGVQVGVEDAIRDVHLGILSTFVNIKIVRCMQ